MHSQKSDNDNGGWQVKIVIDGESFRADLIDKAAAKRAEIDKVYAVDGLPARFERDLIISSQVVDNPHTWRVQEVSSTDEVTEEMIALGRDVLEADRSEKGSHIVTYLGEREDKPGEFEFLAAGAIRNRHTSNPVADEFPIVSRAVVAPSFRNRGLGSVIVRHRLDATLKPYFSVQPKAIHLGTESDKVLHILAKFEDETGLRFVYIGNEALDSDGIHEVRDYLCFMPDYRKEVLEACEQLGKAAGELYPQNELKELFDLFMEQGIKSVLGAELENEFSKVRDLIEDTSDADVKNAIKVIDEVFLVRAGIGATDPV